MIVSFISQFSSILYILLLSTFPPLSSSLGIFYASVTLDYDFIKTYSHRVPLLLCTVILFYSRTFGWGGKCQAPMRGNRKQPLLRYQMLKILGKCSKLLIGRSTPDHYKVIKTTKQVYRIE